MWYNNPTNMEQDKLSFQRSLAIKQQSGHPQTAAVFEVLAKGFDVNVTDEHRRHWRSMLTFGRAIDSYVDTVQPESIEDQKNSLLAGLPIPGMDSDEAHEFHHIIDNVTPVRRAEVLDGFLINDYAKDMRDSRGYARFLHLRLEEAEMFGRFMRLDNPASMPQIERFNEWLPQFARAGYLVDSFGDLYDDFEDGVIAMRPTIRRRLKLGRAALHETKNAVSHLPLRTIGFLAVASLSKILRNGLHRKVALSDE
ncbi:MAG: hypothetical protein JWM07_358 [Candidatus Saccharibacteria bacterium]|nr:hypothetical protein [Candidatus Saccharibacteria bacterium]